MPSMKACSNFNILQCLTDATKNINPDNIVRSGYQIHAFTWLCGSRNLSFFFKHNSHIAVNWCWVSVCIYFGFDLENNAYSSLFNFILKPLFFSTPFKEQFNSFTPNDALKSCEIVPFVLIKLKLQKDTMNKSFWQPLSCRSVQKSLAKQFFFLYFTLHTIDFAAIC